MSSSDSELTNYLTYVSKIVSQLKDTKEENAKLKEENEKLKEEHNTFNEIWKTEGITEQEIIDLKRGHVEKSNLINELKDKLEKSMEVWKFYWSGGLLGEDHTHELRPKSWQKELAEAQGEDYIDSDEELAEQQD